MRNLQDLKISANLVGWLSTTNRRNRRKVEKLRFICRKKAGLLFNGVETNF